MLQAYPRQRCIDHSWTGETTSSIQQEYEPVSSSRINDNGDSPLAGEESDASDSEQDENNLATVPMRTDLDELFRDCSSNQRAMVVKLCDAIDSLEESIKSLEENPFGRGLLEHGPKPELPPRVAYFHRVGCDCGHNGRFTSLRRDIRWSVFLDPPYRVITDKRWHLQGRSNAPDQDIFLDQNPDVVLLVYKDYRCKDDFEYNARPGVLEQTLHSHRKQPSPLSELMMINSPTLAEALSWVINTQEQPRLTGDSNKRDVIKAPYHQFYYNQPPLRQQLTQMDEHHQKHLAPALDYIEQSFETCQREAKDLFSQGLVSLKTLNYLFVPNSNVVREFRGRG